MQVKTDDISVAWGQVPDHRDASNGRWRLAVFQDMQESIDNSKLYFLYDPIADDNCVTTGGRKGQTCLSVFDTHVRCFVGEIPLRVRGRVKFLFALKNPSPAGGTSFVLVSETEDYGEVQLHFWRVNLSSDGMRVESDPTSLLTEPITVHDSFIVSLREDMPEIVCMASPGLTVYRIKADAQYPQAPTDRFSVPGADLSHFYDGFLSMGNVYFMSSSPDGHLDYSRIHVLPLESRGPIGTQHCQADVQRGMPPARKEAGIDSTSGFILIAGGEVDYGSGNVTRLTDYWVLDLTTYRWNQVASQMPIPLIEPRVTTANSGNVYLWGDFDEPLPGMPESGTHLRVLKVTGFNMRAPPSYDQSSAFSQQPHYQGGAPKSEMYPSAPGMTTTPPYPGSANTYPPNSNSPYPNESTQDYGGMQPGFSGGMHPDSSQQYGMQPNPNAPYGSEMTGQQYPHYPPKEKKKDCVIS